MDKQEFKIKNIGFNNEKEYLSNFYNAPFSYNGIKFRNVEQVFQGLKQFPDSNILLKFSKLSASEAKREGRKVTLRKDWEDIKDKIMKTLVTYKFEQNPLLLDRLLNEDDEHLIEYNYWHDNYWGHCVCDKCKNKEKKNMLGKILKEVKYKKLSDIKLKQNIEK